jgi:hypothetical protein
MTLSTLHSSHHLERKHVRQLLRSCRRSALDNWGKFLAAGDMEDVAGDRLFHRFLCGDKE